jgi:glycine betaine/proline transport system substrate-binding protein
MWRPNYVMYKYDMTRVEFPPNTDECWGKTYACQWPDTVVYKLASAGVIDKHPTVWKLLQNYDLNDEQLHWLQTRVIEDGMTPEEAGKAWVEENPEVWKRWLQA